MNNFGKVYYQKMDLFLLKISNCNYSGYILNELCYSNYAFNIYVFYQQQKHNL